MELFFDLTESNGNKKYKIPDKIKDYLKKTSNRRKMLAKCGKTAFLDPEKLRYPVKNPFTCRYDYRLIHAAYVRASEYNEIAIKKKAKQLLDQYDKLQEKKSKSLSEALYVSDEYIDTVSIVFETI